jgi:hypothetical protein
VKWWHSPAATLVAFPDAGKEASVENCTSGTYVADMSSKVTKETTTAVGPAIWRLIWVGVACGLVQ